MADLLCINAVTKTFGGLVAVSGVDMKIKEGQILGLIGPNGAGKTTLFNLITGLYPITSGDIRFKGKCITHMQQYRVVQQGICRTFQELRIFKNLTVLENVLIGMHIHCRGNAVDALFSFAGTRAEEKRAHEKAIYYLNLLGLAEKQDMMAASLPYGDQRRVEVARALAAEPDLLLLDEPAAGMNIAESVELSGFIRWLNRDLNKTILLIEHNMRVVMPVADWVVVLNQGKKIFEGAPMEVQDSSSVIEAYLGRSYLEEMHRRTAHA